MLNSGKSKQMQSVTPGRQATSKEPAHIIRVAIAEVHAIRQKYERQQSLFDAVQAIKRFQSLRFTSTYHDLLTDGPYQDATKFFLTELYGETDFSTRDKQFAQIASAIQRLLPQEAVDTAVCLAQLHVLTERLDLAMGQATIGAFDASNSIATVEKYVNAWHKIGQQHSRQRQLQLLLQIGRDLEALTQTRGLRLLLKMMRVPARSAGLGDLQHFLERGFDTFANMGKAKGATETFLQLIEGRETAVLTALFASNTKDAENYLVHAIRL